MRETFRFAAFEAHMKGSDVRMQQNMGFKVRSLLSTREVLHLSIHKVGWAGLRQALWIRSRLWLFTPAKGLAPLKASNV